MPRGKFLNHKGRNRKFTNPEELEEQRKQDEEKRRRKAQQGDVSGSDDEEAAAKGSGSDSDESSSEDEPGKAKGVSGLIEVENPNRVVKKVKKLSTLNETIKDTPKPELSRREREELERQRGAAAYQKLHAAGATEEARSDLARLALVRQQREEAAKRRELEKQTKEAKSKSGAR